MPLPLIKARVVSVKVLVVEVILYNTQRITEALEVHYLALTEEAYRVGNVAVIAEA